MIGISLANTSGVVGSVGWQPGRIANHWYFAADNITLNTTKIATWGDKMSPAADLTQGTAGKQPTQTTTGGPFGNSAYALFDGNVDTSVGAASAADWKFLHNASDKFFAVSYVATVGSYQVLADTCDWSGTNIGFSFYHRGGTQAVGIQMSNGNGAQALTVESAASSVTDNASHVAIFTMTAAGAYAVYVDGTSVLSGTWANTPSASNPSFALRIGGRASSTSFDFFGKVGEVITGAVVPDAAARARLDAFMRFTAR